uniref:R3H domain-containing protein n=1 Tax=Taeniopygia guttata TaxID=59729 RepID=A0A674HQ68_TAEGU
PSVRASSAAGEPRPAPASPLGPSSCGPRSASPLREAGVDEEVEMAVQLALERFQSGDEAEMEFPSSFTSTERAFVHRLCQSLGLVSKSKG